MVVEFISKTSRQYTGRNGQPRVAHNLNVITPDGEAGALYVSQEIFDAVRAERGAQLRVGFRLNVYRGSAEPQVAGVEVVK